MLPSYQRLINPKSVYFRLPFPWVALISLALALAGFFFGVAWSLAFDFERSTYTECQVDNYLPSISAAIGSYEPQRTVWQLAIFLHFPLRLVLAKAYLEHYLKKFRRSRRLLGILAYILNVVEVSALVCLSFWTSSADYPTHRNAFLLFIACSESYMLISYLLFRSGPKAGLLPLEAKSLRYKRNLFSVNVVCFGLAGYCFVRHNSYCEAGVYTFFALFEYIVVLTNMGFHTISSWDFHDLRVVCDHQRGLYLTQF
ncbi:post-GPI attachment to proteins factor 2-like [Drosophila kikkawai]|uniref:Post-GPI attachment to proteins factor 2-like n=1 Tax=Drosophila kikkawai TaxID=30033 RepID=A0A6P4I8W3_DROKI|nr:post-GPI attachment to proteins factor 2-like [Drosophila kikkawai]